MSQDGLGCLTKVVSLPAWEACKQSLSLAGGVAIFYGRLEARGNDHSVRLPPTVRRKETDFIPWFFLNNLVYLFSIVRVFSAARAFSRRGKQELLCSCSARASHFGGFSCCRAWALGHVDFGSCGTRALELRFRSCWCMGLVASQHVPFPPTRDRIRVSSIGRQILQHWATREAPFHDF